MPQPYASSQLLIFVVVIVPAADAKNTGSVSSPNSNAVPPVLLFTNLLAVIVLGVSVNFIQVSGIESINA